MRVERLELQDFRNYRSAALAPLPGVNVVVGANGAGKTNLLEAIALACTGRSPRGARDPELVREGCERFVVRARILTRTGAYRVAVSGAREGQRRTRIDDQDATSATKRDTLGPAPVVWFGPDDLFLVKGSPLQRRRFVDVLTAQLDPAHAADLGTYARVLTQRNNLLRDVRERRSSRELADLFDDQLVRLGARIIARRLATLEALAPLARERHGHLAAADGALTLGYVHEGEPLARAGEAELVERARAVLERVRSEELARGRTLWGPQRDDVEIAIGGRDARSFASQGQQRSAVLSLKWAEMVLLGRRLGERPLLLLDDVLSELDRERAGALVEFVEGSQQVVMTATELPERWRGRAAAVFHVRAGSLDAGAQADEGGDEAWAARSSSAR